jgi:hypothetical protein
MRLGDVAKFFLAQNIQRDWDNQLLEAVRAGDVARAERLIEAGANVNTRDPKHAFQTPLHLAARIGQSDMIVLLVEKGADVAGMDQSRRTPFDYGMECGHLRILHLLQSPAPSREYRRVVTPLPHLDSPKPALLPGQTSKVRKSPLTRNIGQKKALVRREPKSPNRAGHVQKEELSPEGGELVVGPWGAVTDFGNMARPVSSGGSVAAFARNFSTATNNGDSADEQSPFRRGPASRFPQRVHEAR